MVAAARNPHSQLEFIDMGGAFVKEEGIQHLRRILSAECERPLLIRTSSRATVSGLRFVGTCGWLPLERETRHWIPDEAIRRRMYTLPEDQVLAGVQGWGGSRALLSRGFGMTSKLMARLESRRAATERKLAPLGGGDGAHSAGNEDGVETSAEPGTPHWSVTPMGGDAVLPETRSPASAKTRLAQFRKHAQLARARRRLPWKSHSQQS